MVSKNTEDLVKQIAEQVTTQIQSQLENIVNEAVNQRLQDLAKTSTLEEQILSRVDESIKSYQPAMSVFFENRIQSANDNIIRGMGDKANELIKDTVSTRLASVNVGSIAREYVIGFLDSNKTNYIFPERSIPGIAIDRDSLVLPGDCIDGGIIKNFGSTGIDDKATTCQMTLLDDGIVFENTVYTRQLEVKGDAVIDGDLIIKGTIPADSATYQNLVRSISDNVKDTIGIDMLDQYQDRVFDRIKNEGIDLSKINIDGVTIIDGRRLTSAITESNLQSVGQLKDLQTQGETLLSNTLYVGNRRVGVNTMDPSTALSVWDEEIEIGIGKQKQNVARISTKRDQSLVLGSNNQDNITLASDGSAVIPKLQIGNVPFTSAPAAPSISSPRGTVVINENPTLGGPLGWVSLGDSRWANFGIID
jgi:hypothetical protein